MANSYLDAYRQGKTVTSSGGGSNPYLEDYRKSIKKRKKVQQETAKAVVEKKQEAPKQETNLNPIDIAKNLIKQLDRAAADVLTPEPIKKLRDTVLKAGESNVDKAVSEGKISADQGKSIKDNARKSTEQNLSSLTGVPKLYEQTKLTQERNKNFGKDTNPNKTATYQSPIKNISELTSKPLPKAGIDTVKQDLELGKITKAQADKKTAELISADKSRAKALSAAEKTTGIKYDPAGTLFAIIDLASTSTGLGQVAKTAFKTAATQLSKRFGRDLTEKEATDLATDIKKRVPEEPITKPRNGTAVVGKEPTNGDAIIQKLNEADNTAPTEGDKIISELNTPEGTTSIPVTAVKSGDQVIADLGKTEAPTPLPVSGDKIVEELQTVDTKAPGAKLPDDADTIVKELQSLDRPKGSLRPLGKQAEPPKLKPEGDTVSGNAARIQERAIEKKLTDNLGDLPQYKAINMKEQADESIALIRNDRQHAIDIIEGKRNPPGNLKAQSVHQALEEVAIREGGVDLLRKLASSHINTELSEGAQKLRIAAERDPHSAVENIRQVRDARIKAAEKRNKGRTISQEAKDIKKAIKVKTPVATKQTWKQFIEELEC